jgi:hypothetical protein
MFIYLCGPDAPTLASRRRKAPLPNRALRGASFRRRWWQTSPVTGESTKETVKTIACGNAGCSGVSAVDTRVLSTFCTRGHGCSGHPVFPTPSDFLGGRFGAELGRMASREGIWSSRRRPGPITPGVDDEERSLPQRQDEATRRMGPGSAAGTRG